MCGGGSECVVCVCVRSVCAVGASQCQNVVQSCAAQAARASASRDARVLC